MNKQSKVVTPSNSVILTRFARLTQRLIKLKTKLTPGRKFVISIPYVWLIVFFVLPFLILLRISVTDLGNGLNPFVPVMQWLDGVLQIHLKISNYLSIFVTDDAESVYVSSYVLSLKYAFYTTILCLFFGYPFAYFIARAKESLRPALLMLVMLPFWTSFLLRIYAWKGLLGDTGVFNNVLMWLELIDDPIPMLYNDVSMLIGMTYVYLPFMVLPLYATLVKMDFRLLEAAFDLGASPWRAFWLVTVPLSRAGIIAGSMLVFIPAIGEFVIPSLLGGAENIMIGRVVWDEMFNNLNWPRASALAVVMIVMILVPIAVYNHFNAKTMLSKEGR